VKRVLLLATTTGYQIRSFGEAAEALGVRLVFASDRCDQLEDPWWDQAIPVRFQDETRSVDAVVAACGDTAPDGIVAVGDRPAVLAAHLARAFGLPGHTSAAAAACRNKLTTRQALWAAGLPTPWFDSMPIDGDAEGASLRVEYPAVLKPLALSGSRGVMRVNDSVELDAALERLRRLLDARDVRIDGDEAHGHVLVEGFIPGAEYAIEGLLTHGTLQLLAICDKPDPLDGPFFEETIYRMPSLAPHTLQRRIGEVVAAACAALGLHHGPVHAECRVSGDTVYVLEVAARPIGGLCSSALRFRSTAPTAAGGTGVLVSLEEVLLRHALGEHVRSYVREDAASGVMMIPIPKRGVYRSVGGLEEAARGPGIEDIRITAKPDAMLVPVPEGKSYLGFIFARGETPGAVDRALRDAHAKLRFVIDREVAVSA
jgi:formate-dependent phosphoribosylglycinamide formyltransferase (GAR transformylase)